MPVRLVPIRWFHLRRLRRWRGIPNHLRHPGIPSWPHHLRWWWRTKHDPTLWMRAVVDAETGELVGSAGVTGLRWEHGEVSVLCIRKLGTEEREDALDTANALAMVLRTAPARVFVAEVYTIAPQERHRTFDSQMTKISANDVAWDTFVIRIAQPHLLGASFYRYTRDA